MAESDLHLLYLLSIPDFCREYNTSRSNVYCMIRDRTLPAVKVGKMTRIRRPDAEAWAASLPPAGRSKRKPTPKPKPSSRPVRGAKRKARRRPASPRRSVRSDG